jgi:hypothetical protein
MPETETLFRRNRLGDGDVIDLTIIFGRWAQASELLALSLRIESHLRLAALVKEISRWLPQPHPPRPRLSFLNSLSSPLELDASRNFTIASRSFEIASG